MTQRKIKEITITNIIWYAAEPESDWPEDANAVAEPELYDVEDDDDHRNGFYRSCG